MATPQDVPIRIRATQDHRRMLDELEVFWNETTSEVIRRAIALSHELYIVWRRDGDLAIERVAAEHADALREQYEKRTRELAELRRQMLGDESPLIPARR